MKNVLIVDDEDSFLLSLTDMFKDCGGKFDILTAGDGKQAIKILEKENVSLVVTDLKMPELDGFGLLSHMSKTTPNTPVIVMTAFGTPDMEDQILDMGAFQYIEKPIEFDLLLTKINEGLTAGTTGHVAGISTASFLQLLEMERKTCTLTIQSEGRRGNLYFKQGELINATTDEHEGQDAAFHIIGWDNVEIDILNMCRKRKKVIDVPMGYILIESARLKDEQDNPQDAEQESGSPSTSEPTTPSIEQTVDELNLEDLDFDGPEIEVKKTTDSPPVTTTATTKDQTKSKNNMVILDSLLEISDVETTEHFLQVVSAIDGVKRVIGLSREGSRLEKSTESNPELDFFLGKVVETSGEYSRTYDFGRMEHLTIAQKDGIKLSILTGPEIILAIEFDAKAPVNDILKEIRPTVNRISAH